jgi:hypothetical protein
MRFIERISFIFIIMLGFSQTSGAPAQSPSTPQSHSGSRTAHSFPETEECRFATDNVAFKPTRILLQVGCNRIIVSGP